MVTDLAIYCADIGSVAANRFAWFAKPYRDPRIDGASMGDLAKSVADDLLGGVPVALGFECPLFVPITERPERLTAAREGEGNRPWSAGAGCCVLTTGLVQVVWTLREIRRLVGDSHRAFLDWHAFKTNGAGIFVWEALVSGEGKRNSDAADAEAAVEAFDVAKNQSILVSAVTCAEETYSLIGSALLRSGWAANPAILRKPCIVVRATPRAAEERH